MTRHDPLSVGDNIHSARNSNDSPQFPAEFSYFFTGKLYLAAIIYAGTLNKLPRCQASYFITITTNHGHVSRFKQFTGCIGTAFHTAGTDRIEYHGDSVIGTYGRHLFHNLKPFIVKGS